MLIYFFDVENGCQLSPRHFYFCKNGDCVKKAWRCDRELDCVDGDDEFDCGKYLLLN